MKPKNNLRLSQQVLSLLGIMTLGFFGLAAPVFAGTPVLSAAASGNNYTLTVDNADASAAITLYMSQGSSNWSHIYNWGTTDGYGHFSATQGLAFDGSSNPLQLYVTVDGLQSGTVQVYASGNGNCTTNCGTGLLSLSQTVVALGTNQNNVITAYPTGGGSIYISGNNNPGAVSTSISGNSITVGGLATGSATITVCQSGGSQCGTITVSVNGASTSGITFSNASPTILLGQSLAVNVYSTGGSSNGFYISSNGNSNTVSASLSGSVLNLSAQSVGTSSISVCQTGTGFCGTLNVTVGSNGTQGSMNLSTNTLNLSPGQTGTATVSNAYGTLYVSNNSNNSVASAGISGQTVSVYGIAAGSSTLSICQNGYSGCVSLFVVVSGSGNSISGSLSFSTANPVLTMGQSQSVTIYSPNGGTAASYYINTNSNSNAVSASLNGSTLSLFGQNAGVATINVCQNGYSYCGNVYATVNGYSGGVTLSQSTLNLNLNQTSTISLTGGSGTYVLTSNTSPNVASVSLSGSSLYVTALNNGNTTLTVCQSGNTSACGQAVVNVGTVSGSGIVTFSSNSPTVAVGQTQSITIYATNGWSGSYAVTANSNSAVATVNVAGSALTLTGVANGVTNLTICQTGSSICGNLSATIGSGSGSPIVFSTGSLPAATINQPYSATLSSTGGDGTYAYSITSGGLPAGLSLSSAGIISGTATATGTANFGVTVQSAGNTASAYFTLAINGAVSMPDNSSGGGTTTDTNTNSGTLANGELINENGTVFMIYNGTKTPFASADAFLGLGFSFSNVNTVTDSGLPLSGKVVVTAKGAHPRGTWLLSGQTVYFLTPNGTIAVPDWNTFLGNGGQASFLVQANSYDLAMPKLPIMTASDSRLQP